MPGFLTAPGPTGWCMRFTEQAVDYLFRQGCRLIVLACHTASARALRAIQQVYLRPTTPATGSWGW